MEASAFRRVALRDQTTPATALVARPRDRHSDGDEAELGVEVAQVA